MIHVSSKGLVKKFTGNIVFSQFEIEIPFKSKIAIIGPNGSGKTTLLQILAGLSLPSEGKVSYSIQSKDLDMDEWYSKSSFCSAYQELIEEFTAKELADFHFSLKKITTSLNIRSFLEVIRLDRETSKPIKFYSTGMKQRLKLGLALCSDYPILFLDEPTSNLDKPNFNWYLEMIEQYAQNKTIIISSNFPDEYSFCNQTVNILDYK